jgi:hypothetical protein
MGKKLQTLVKCVQAESYVLLCGRKWRMVGARVMAILPIAVSINPTEVKRPFLVTFALVHTAFALSASHKRAAASSAALPPHTIAPFLYADAHQSHCAVCFLVASEGLATRLYEFGEGGDVKLVRPCFLGVQKSAPNLRKLSILQLFR